MSDEDFNRMIGLGRSSEASDGKVYVLLQAGESIEIRGERLRRIGFQLFKSGKGKYRSTVSMIPAGSYFWARR